MNCSIKEIENSGLRCGLMNLLAAHSYLVVKREIKDFQQLMIEEERIIFLYTEKIVTQHNEFPIQTVFDISYLFAGCLVRTMFLGGETMLTKHDGSAQVDYNFHKPTYLLFSNFL
jgi:hypothetical protein